MTKKRAFVVLNPEKMGRYVSDAFNRTCEYISAELQTINLLHETTAIKKFLGQFQGRIRTAVSGIREFYLGDLPAIYRKEYSEQVAEELKKKARFFSVNQDNGWKHEIATSLEYLAGEIIS